MQVFMGGVVGFVIGGMVGGALFGPLGSAIGSFAVGGPLGTLLIWSLRKAAQGVEEN